jgi:Cu(I)/Ag(I) efflux system membrane protein CusA/SilA
VLVVVWGISTSPFNWHGGIIPRNPIPVDAIPDIGDNQQIVATEWMGRSPKDIQDQITYPLTTSLLGIPEVKSIRSSSMFGMSFIYIIFDDNIEFYWSRSRILEKLNSLPPGTLPEGVQPALDPDATALGQIYWYTLEGRDPATGKPTGGWNAEELRTIQDYYIKYSLSAAEGVSEVASAEGFVKEYQVELNPDAMRAFNVSVMDIMGAIKKSNLDIGAETMEINKVEYLIRGLGYIKDVSDLEKAVVFVESIIRYMEMPENRGVRKGKAMVNLIYKAVSEVSGAIATAMITTIVSFLPVFAMEAQEGKMFSPLAYTKTYALASAFVLGLILLPTLSYILFSVRIDSKRIRSWKKPGISNYINIGIALVVATYFLAEEWLPMGPQKGIIVNLLFVTGCIAIILALLWLLVIYYERILRWCLNNRWKFMLLPIATILCGILIWKRIGQEFMPSLNEGSFLLMPTSMPHTGIEQNLNYIEALDKRLAAIPEVETAIGKWGRVNSALDPAPAQMFENTINYRPEYILNEDGKRERFKVNRKGEYLLRNGGTYNPADGFRLIPADSLIPDRKGDYFRQWRPEIKNTDDIWQQIVNVTHLPGLTSAPKLQPIEARLVMLSTGMRAPMGLKIYGPDLETIEQSGKAIEQALKDVPSVIPSSVFYDRAVGAPYLEIKLNRDNMARYGVNVEDLQEILSAAVGGMILTKTVEGRERFPVRLRYARELRDNPEALSMLLVPTATGAQIPLKELADIEYARGTQMIQSENTFLVGYVIFDKKQGKAEVDVVKEATKVIEGKIQNGELKLTKGVSYKFAGNYEQQERATARLMIVVPLALLIVLLVLYFQFKTLTASLIHFSGVFVAFAGGFILLWLYGQDWFMNFSLAGVNMRDLFQMHTINLSVAVWVGFIALFGVATDDGVLMGTYIHHVFLEKDPQTRHAIREAVVTAGLKRVRPAAMTTATTLVALLPVLTSTGKGADIMVPMAIPTFGGMLIQSMTMFVVPVFQCWWREGLLKKEETTGRCLAQNRPVHKAARLVPVDLPVDDPRIFGRDDFPHGHHPTGTPVVGLQP